MDRAEVRPEPRAGAGQGAGANRGAGNVAGGGRPTTGQINNFMDAPGRGAGAAGAAGAGRGTSAAADFLQGGGGSLAAGAVAGGAAAAGIAARTDAGRPGTGRENFAQNQPGRVENRGERQGTRDQRRDEVRNQYNDHNPGNFWQENPGWTAFAVTRPFAWANWGSVGSWTGYTEEPVYYNYGENVYYSGDQVYSGDQPIATTEEYADQAATIAASVPTEAPASSDWMPLGVFAITQDGQASGTQPSIYMQLGTEQAGHDFRHAQKRSQRNGSAAGRHGRQNEPASRLGCHGSRAADHGDGAVEPDARHVAGADPFCRRVDAAVADGTHSRTEAVAAWGRHQP